MFKTKHFDFKNTFLNLTQYTVPYGDEYTHRQHLPEGIQQDEDGNYFITVGESSTLFTSHLDTCSFSREKVNHVINGDIIATDGTTILGGDNKAGVTILLYLISQGVPGTYYFFVGEEIGTVGSRAALRANRLFFSQFKRAVAFDRRGEGSIITHQRGARCCSDQFAVALADEFGLHGLGYEADPTGVFTDTAVFTDIIPECTNLSAGVWNEHRRGEYVNIKIVEQIAKAAAKVQWEDLPSARDPLRIQRQAA
ncbi:zinc-binding metallopeptidase family protein [Rufibacter roseus]|uniref:Uncharacterized protein n=1 Tax=Rufibacter roseus TaxID=1567108 RepID=A0ABW2DL02_9BACT|nr:hypothetical protein [Rufibacter roseus]